ncbi:chromosome condensation regulator RCC1 [soil metagenome]
MISVRWGVALVALIAGCGRIGFDAQTGDGGGSEVPGDGPAASCFRGLSAGRLSTCAIDARGDVWCWGNNGERETDPASSVGHVLIPAKVTLSGPVAQVRVGNQFTCARLEDGQVQCWGNNTYGELGNGTNIDGGPFVVSLGTERAKELVVGAHTACIVRVSDGGVSCWGDSASGVVSATTNVPLSTPVLAQVHGLVVAHRHACALDAMGTVWCWGRAADGQIGPPFSDRFTPTPVSAFGPAVALAAGGKFTCALDAMGAVRCMGQNDLGELGNNTFFSTSTPVSTDLTDAVEIGGGARGVCARRTNGSVRCWGAGYDGFLGDSTLDTLGVSGAAASSVSSISVGFHHVCGFAGDQIVCWGSDTDAQLGRGSRAIATLPQLWGSGTPITSLAMGLEHGCLVRDNLLQCWGRNAERELGDGTRSSRIAATAIALPFSPLGVAAGHKTTCAFAGAGMAACWGRGEVGQLGDSAVHLQPSNPVLVTGATAVTAISVGGGHACAIDGTAVKCWGADNGGQLGTTTTNNRATPVVVTGLTAPTRITAGGEHTCAIHRPMGLAEATCWGRNTHGQLGDNTTTNRDLVGASVALAGAPIEISAGNEHTCAIIANGDVYCWGRNDGLEVGVTGGADRLLPQLVTLPAPAVSITATTRGTCVALADGRVYCWGVGTSGELGNGTVSGGSLPVQATVTNAKLVARSGSAVCAGLGGGEIACWGAAQSGQLGSGLRSDVSTPMPVPLSCLP